MKNTKSILTYIVAAVSILVISASSSLCAPPQNYTGMVTHGEFYCDDQILNPPAYSVAGVWVLSIDSMTQPPVPPRAYLTINVFRDGSPYVLFPHIELTPVSLQNGLYTYTFGPQVTVTLDTTTAPATFGWHVEFGGGCPPEHPYDSLTFFGLANN